MTEGHIPGSPVSWINSASLAALKKTYRSHVPVAVGENVRRLTAKALLIAVSEDMTRYLRPSQLGFASANVCEAIVHATRRWLQSHSIDERRCLPTTDLEGAGPPSAWIGQVLRPVLLEQQLRVVRTGENPQQISWSLLHAAISEGRSVTESSNCPADMAPSTSTTERSAAPTKPHRPSLQASTLDDRGRELKPTKCEYISAKLLPRDVLPPEAPTRWKVRHDTCFTLPDTAFVLPLSLESDDWWLAWDCHGQAPPRPALAIFHVHWVASVLRLRSLSWCVSTPWLSLLALRRLLARTPVVSLVGVHPLQDWTNPQRRLELERTTAISGICQFLTLLMPARPRRHSGSTRPQWNRDGGLR